MKKAIALVVVLMFAAILFVGCAPTTEKKAETAVATVEATSTVATKEVTKTVVKTEKNSAKTAK